MKKKDPYVISSEEELRRELSRFFRSAYRHEGPIGPTWVVEYEDQPSVEIVAHRLAENGNRNRSPDCE